MSTRKSKKTPKAGNTAQPATSPVTGTAVTATGEITVDSDVIKALSTLWLA